MSNAYIIDQSLVHLNTLMGRDEVFGVERVLLLESFDLVENVSLLSLAWICLLAHMIQCFTSGGL